MVVEDRAVDSPAIGEERGDVIDDGVIGSLSATLVLGVGGCEIEEGQITIL